LDLNVEFHELKFPEQQNYYQDAKNWSDYSKKTKDFVKLASDTYSENNKKVVNGKKPELFNDMLDKIKEKKPDIVAFSIVYSSQAFYAYALMKELKNVLKIIGGPAVNEKLMKIADKTLNNEIELLDFIYGKKPEHNDVVPDFSHYDLKKYFTPEPVIPIKTSNSCYYRKCTYCSHFSRKPYCEFPLEQIKKTIADSKQKHFFLIDDMIPKKRLLEIAEILRPLNIKWTCQLKPTCDLNFEALKKLRESGLAMVMWGVESGNNRILGLINKGTNAEDIQKVLQDSHKAGIKNIAYILFGFPTETKDEFLDTINFLKNNEQNIDLVSSSVFGLQKNTLIYNNPEKFGIIKITEEQRTVLEPKISYGVSHGLTQKQANKLRRGYKKTMEKINKYPKTMNYFREHMLCLIS
jgi:radical SAM superfamily enzyme YgiQ (UPF0313 family)